MKEKAIIFNALFEFNSLSFCGIHYFFGYFILFLNLIFFTATSTDARIKQEVHEEPAIKMQKTDHVAQRRISQHKNSPVAPQLAPPSSLPFPWQQSASVWQNPYLQAMASKLLLGNGQSPFTQFQAAQTNMFAANPLLGNPATRPSRPSWPSSSG